MCFFNVSFFDLMLKTLRQLVSEKNNRTLPKTHRKCNGFNGSNGIVLVLMETIMVSTGM